MLPACLPTGFQPAEPPLDRGLEALGRTGWKSCPTFQPSDGTRLHVAARARLLAGERGPLFLGDWHAPVFLHFARGGRLGAWLCWPLREQSFLNLRTYVRVDGEPGITFLAEWLTGRVNVRLGPALYGLPYHRGEFRFRHEPDAGRWSGRVSGCDDGAGKLRYTVSNEKVTYAPAVAGSRDEFLLERHTCYLAGRGRGRRFRIWHEPWPQRPASARVGTDTLLSRFAPWWQEGRFLSANVSPGARDVWMGRPQRLG